MRLSREKELQLFPDELEKHNIETFKKLLPYFYLDEESKKRVLDNLEKDKRSAEENYLDEKFKLNDQRRVWFKLRLVEQFDQSFRYYKKVIEGNSFIYNDSLLRNVDDVELRDSIIKEESNKLIKIIESDLFNYDDYKKGIVVVNKQSMKLFKFLMKNKLFLQHHLDELNTLKNKKDIYVCISRNPIDYLFCATDQSFGSCENLYSEYRGAYYMGLGPLILDPNRCIMFSVQDSPKECRIKGEKFYHFRYINRTWGIYGNDPDRNEGIRVIRYYPNSKINFAKELKDVVPFIPVYYGKFPYKIPKYVDGRYATIYHDHLGLLIDRESIGRYDKHEGRYDSCYTELGHSRGFDCFPEEIFGLRNRNRPGESIPPQPVFVDCAWCGDSIESEYAIMTVTEDFICQDCNDEYGMYCEYCESTLHVDEFTSLEGVSICNGCFDDIACECTKCNNYFFESNAIYFDDEYYCESCLDEIATECTGCGELTYLDDLDDEDRCQGCHEEEVE